MVRKRAGYVVGFVVLCLLFCFTAAMGADTEKTAKKPADENLRVAVLPFESDLQGDPKSGAMISEILAARLSVAGNLTVVDRLDIDKVLKEQGLGASGAITPDQAARVGRLLGAQLLITGRAMSQTNNTLVFCKAVSAETGQLKGCLVTLPKEADLPALVEKTAAELQKSLPSWAKDLLPPALQPVDYAAALKTQAKGKTIPKIAVWIPESHFGRMVVDPAVETEFQLLLTEAGLTPVEVSPKTIESLRSVHLPEAQPTSGAAETAIPEQLKKAFPDVRYLICGEAFSEDGRELHGLFVSSARAEVKIVDLQTGKIILVDRATDHAPDLSARVAGKTALQKAGRALAIRMLPKLVDNFEEQK
jgi:TolB-like protein